MAILGPVLQKFLDRYLFSSSKVVSRRVRSSLPNVKEILGHELGLKRSSIRSVPQLPSDGQKKLRMDASQRFLSMLGESAEHDFEEIATGGESWFQDSCYSHSMFADSRGSVVP
jgi:hypothetical protein